jgi:hypothetical protein
MRLIIKNIAILLLAWLVMIAFDLFLHAGLLARLYTQESPFLLTAEAAFRRIPLGYVSFFLLGVLLLWLMSKAQVSDRKNGFIFGATVGSITWGALTLGLYSISTAPPTLLLGWWLGQALELGLAGYVFGADRQGIKRGRILRWALFFLLLSIVLTVAMQAAGLAPAMKTI